MSEALHDRFDDVLEGQLDSDVMVLTAWSEDSFSDTLWEFINVHASEDIKYAKILIIASSTSAQMNLLSEIASTVSGSASGGC
jgi:hypothetical protein